MNPASELIEATKQKDMRKVVALLKSGHSVDEKDENGETALTTAARFGNVDFLKTLLAVGADPSAKGHKGQTALMHVTTRLVFDRADAISALIKSGADVNAKADNGSTALMWAAENKQESSSAIVNLVLHHGADANARDNKGETSLMLATKSGLIETVQILLSKGADVNARNNEGTTPLMWAVITDLTLAAPYVGNAFAVYLLLRKGADTNIVDQYGKTALMWGKERERETRSTRRAKIFFTKAVDLIQKAAAGEPLSTGDVNSDLLFASIEGEVIRIREFLENGADVNSTDDDGYTALIWSVKCNHKETMLWLIRHGANINVRFEGRPLLQIAAMNGNIAIMTQLLQRGVDVNEKNDFGQSALAWAEYTGHSEVAEFLRRAGAKGN